MSTTGILWLAMMELEKHFDAVLTLCLLKVVPETGLAALLMIKAISVRLYI
jgi:hypothetical protein